MHRARFFFCVSTMALLSAWAPAQIVQSKGGYVIFVKYTKGQTITQNMSMQALGPSNLKSSSTFVTKCTDVDKKGIATVDVVVSTGGKVQTTKKKIRVDRHGKPLGTTIDGYAGTFVWPETPVKIGQSWDGNLTMAPGGAGAGGAIQSKYKLVGFKTIKGTKVASIAATLSVGGNFDVKGTDTIYVRYSDGQLHSADFDLGLKQFTESGTDKRLKLHMAIRTVI